jgi:hypothetical protein
MPREAPVGMTAFLSAMPALRSWRGSGNTAVRAFEPTTTNCSCLSLYTSRFQQLLQESVKWPESCGKSSVSVNFRRMPREQCLTACDDAGGFRSTNNWLPQQGSAWIRDRNSLRVSIGARTAESRFRPQEVRKEICIGRCGDSLPELSAQVSSP